MSRTDKLYGRRQAGTYDKPHKGNRTKANRASRARRRLTVTKIKSGAAS